MTETLKIAVAGLRLIGQHHVTLLRDVIPGMSLTYVIDPAEQAAAFSQENDVVHFASLTDLFQEARPDGIIVSTPNQTHVENGLECVAAGYPLLVDKPIATSTEPAGILVDAAARKNVPLLVGHHRRHDPIVHRAKAIIDAGDLGKLKVCKLLHRISIAVSKMKILAFVVQQFFSGALGTINISDG